MPVYSFSKIEFVPMIESGRKPHTIRPKRKRPTKPGDTLYLYYKQRTPECRFIGKAPCVRVLPVVIWPRMMLIKVNGRVLAPGASLKLAKADGFNDLTSFYRFFERYGRECLDEMELVMWDPKRLEVER